MAYIHACDQCADNGQPDYDNEYWHSIYLENPIEYGISKITGKRHYHSNQYEAKTLADIKHIIRWLEGLERNPPERRK